MTNKNVALVAIGIGAVGVGAYFLLRGKAGAAPPAKARLTITTTPVAGDIYLSGVKQGTGSIETTLSPGTYGITFGDVAGWVTPVSVNVTLLAGEQRNVTGLYAQSGEDGALAIQLSMEALAKAQLAVDDILSLGTIAGLTKLHTDIEMAQAAYDAAFAQAALYPSTTATNLLAQATAKIDQAYAAMLTGWTNMANASKADADNAMAAAEDAYDIYTGDKESAIYWRTQYNYWLLGGDIMSYGTPTPVSLDVGASTLCIELQYLNPDGSSAYPGRTAAQAQALLNATWPKIGAILNGDNSITLADMPSLSTGGTGGVNDAIRLIYIAINQRDTLSNFNSYNNALGTLWTNAVGAKSIAYTAAVAAQAIANDLLILSILIDIANSINASCQDILTRLNQMVQ